MLKKYLLCLLATCILFSGCAVEPKKVTLNPQRPININLWHYYNGTQQVALDALIKEFNETEGLKQGIVVEAVSQGNVEILAQRVQESALKKVGSFPMPNIFASYADTAFMVDQMGGLIPLDGYFTAEELSQYVPGYLEEGRFGDGTLKIIPVAKSTEVMVLNQTDWEAFAKETGASLEDLSTIEGVIRTAEKYYTYSDGKAFFGRDSMANYMLIGARQLGIELFQVEEGVVTLQCDRPVLKRVWDGFYSPYVKGYFAANGRFRSDDIKVKDILLQVGSVSGAVYFPKQVILSDTEQYPIEMLSLPCPRFEGAENFAVQQGAGMAVARSTPKEELASALFLKWITTDVQNLRLSLTSGYLPVKTTANRADVLQQYMDQSIPPMEAQLQKVLLTAAETTSRATMYTSKPFPNGGDARAVLERSLIERSRQDRQRYLDLLATGLSPDDAMQTLNPDACFEEWYTDLTNDLQEIIKK